MKKIISIAVLLLLITSFCFAGDLQKKHCAVIAKKNVPAGTSCTDVEDSATGTTDSVVTWAEGDETIYQAQAFTVDSSYEVCKIEIYGRKVGAPTFTVYARIYNTSSSLPGTQVGGTSDAVAISGWSTSSDWHTFTFSGVKPSLSAGTYWIVLYTTNGPADWTNYAGWDKEVTTTCSVGAEDCIQYSTNGTTWTDLDNRVQKFRTYK